MIGAPCVIRQDSRVNPGRSKPEARRVISTEWGSDTGRLHHRFRELPRSRRGSPLPHRIPPVARLASPPPPVDMGFVSFAGRVLFASVFLLSAYQEFTEFGTDGGPAAKNLEPKFNSFTKNISVHLGVVVPHVELKHVIAATIGLKGLGGLLFILSSSFGAYLLALYLAFITPVVYDFYNYDMEKAEFVQIFMKFTQNLALFGALLFFLGMKNSVPKRQAKKKAPKSKTT
ncbi:hypothetical protein VPH35_079796 [Triticum aestivum]